MQKIVVFIDETDDPSLTPMKIGNLFMNRFSIDEDAGFETLKILNPKFIDKFNYRTYHRGFKGFDIDRRDRSGSKGLDLKN